MNDKQDKEAMRRETEEALKRHFEKNGQRAGVTVCPTALGIPANGIGADNRGIHQCRLSRKGK